ncbi:SusD/RagB family nutrient-binding outer membrane lipoprotein [Arcicella lustrica]|uniref:SusD/RagB family nutrient-binding outer membrane lipoprotein n=1 Tax=Arcicella lustrica TaxID=2984196 RepID=A0ABU5SKA3_9BACT|nr:SusD/RagB family nutrient-binding outer membrane lipoprotein [Arcicella sp. DC25W]MEA5427726.1 SusD/RagB family nutrient-binding outer membrane lipoprotein [Arcicella sp. DC25W]
MLKKITICASLILSMGACTKDFEVINVNPNTPSSVPIDYLLGESELFIPGSSDASSKAWRINFGFAACFVQQMSSIDVTFYGGSFYNSGSNNFTSFFDYSYPNAVKSLVNVIDIAKKDAKYINVLSMARILKVMEMARLTDLYGDIPYSEAGKAFLDGNFSPKYDAQKDIYFDMLKELDEAGKAFSATAYIPKTADYIYSGDLDKWKRAANTLMLRLAMRLQKVDATSAQSWAKKAIDGGLITSNSETIAFKFDNTGAMINSNPNSWVLGPSGQNIANLNNAGVQWGKTLIDLLKTRKDPRLSVISSLRNGDKTIENQRGLPNATDAIILNTLEEKNLNNYSRPSSNLMSLATPWIYMTYAEAQLLKAEAIERGWVSGSAKTAFIEGQSAGINQLSVVGSTITASDLSTYATLNAYPETGNLDNKLNAIHTELYLIHASTLNHIEAWANWRRTGYPNLNPVNYSGNETGGVIPRRLRYPLSELGINPNFKDAITRQGPDLFTTKVWWDK